VLPDDWLPLWELFLFISIKPPFTENETSTVNGGFYFAEVGVKKLEILRTVPKTMINDIIYLKIKLLESIQDRECIKITAQ
jgi:hypothetical protein